MILITSRLSSKVTLLMETYIHRNIQGKHVYDNVSFRNTWVLLTIVSVNRHRLIVLLSFVKKRKAISPGQVKTNIHKLYTILSTNAGIRHVDIMFIQWYSYRRYSHGRTSTRKKTRAEFQHCVYAVKKVSEKGLRDKKSSEKRSP